MRKLLHLIPTAFLVILCPIVMAMYFGLVTPLVDVTFILLGVLALTYLFSIFYAPFEEKSDFLLEGFVLLPLLFLVPSSNHYFLSHFPYSSPVFLVPLAVFVLYLIIFLVKISQYYKKLGSKN